MAVKETVLAYTQLIKTFNRVLQGIYEKPTECIHRYCVHINR